MLYFMIVVITIFSTIYLLERLYIHNDVFAKIIMDRMLTRELLKSLKNGEYEYAFHVLHIMDQSKKGTRELIHLVKMCARIKKMEVLNNENSEDKMW